MGIREQAADVLSLVRSRLADRLASAVLKHQAALMEPVEDSLDPLALHPEIERLCQGVAVLESAIEALRRAHRVPEAASRPAPPPPVPAPPKPTIFSTFFDMVQGGQLERASRELARVISIPLDQAFTATRFCARALKADGSVRDRLEAMYVNLHVLSPAQCMRELVRAFGLQAVETATAIEALRAAHPHIPATPGVPLDGRELPRGGGRMRRVALTAAPPQAVGAGNGRGGSP